MTPGEPRPHENELRDYWDALVAGETDLPSDVDPALAETIRQFHALDDAPAPDPALMETTWRQLTGEALSTAPLVTMPATAPVANGHRPAELRPHEFARVATAKRIAATDAGVRLVRLLAIAVIAGIAAGFVAGLGARVAMRIAALLAGSAARGALTDNDAVVGEITLGGTLALAIGGAIFGPLGGLVYVAMRGSLPWSGFRRGALYGALLLGTFGYVIMDPSNPDYRRFGSPGLNVCTFSAVYLVFGLVAAPLTDWLDRVLPVMTSGDPRQRRLSATTILLLPFGVIGLLVASLGIVVFGPGMTSLLFAATIYGLPIARMLLTRYGVQIARPDRLFPRQRAALAAYALLAAPSLAGLVVTVRAIAEILGAG